MLVLLGVLLSCGVLCLASPVPPTAGAGCTISPIIWETLSNVEELISKGSSEITPPNYEMEEGGDVITYLEQFIKALNNSKEDSKEGRIAYDLQQIKNAGKSCPRWMEQDWEPDEEEGFLQNLKYLLKFLNHYAF